jgi:DNA-directed RNA polymerase specialized sigma24 family protein
VLPDAEVAQLVRAAAAGEQQAWESLVARFAPLVLAVAQGHGLTYGTSADVVQTTFLRLAESLDAVSGRDVGAWVAGSARAESLHAVRWADPRLDARPRSPGTQDVTAALQQLSARARLALHLLAVAGVSDSARAAGLGMTDEDASLLLRDSLDRCRAVLEPAVALEDLVAQLRETLGRAPDDSVLAAARAAYSWRSPTGQLAPTSYDSLLDEAVVGGLTSVRSTSGPRLLSFAGAGLELDVEVSIVGNGRRLLGQLIPAVRTAVTIRHGGRDELESVTDADGRFAVDDLLPGALSLLCAAPAGDVRTGWVLV